MLSAAEVLSLWVSPSGRGAMRVMSLRWTEEAAGKVTGNSELIGRLIQRVPVFWYK